MAGKFRAGRELILGLVVAAWGLALVVDVSEAGRKERRARKAPEASTATQQQERPQPPVARTDSSPAEAPTPEQVAAIARAQRCWAKLGYYKAEIDGKRGRATRSAFSQFKREHGLANENDILAEPVQQKIAELCKTQTDEAPLDAANDPLAPQQEAGTGEPQTPSEEATLASP